ncbi:uncharacterized protein LOC128232260 [Mya arenaria]|uniref:uncharacterized protein LOC128232260 n=1 Tax=Mya arenaria TaxID=6604 RepID=UPI0022E8E5DE|nr:uncharacterized protein LOC128232260 [Mya arenaria]
MIRWSLLVFGCVLVFRHRVETAVGGTTCSLGGNECSGIANSFCDVPNLVCKCVDIATEDTGASTCPLTVCSSDPTLCTDANSECLSSTACACKTLYELSGGDNANACTAKVCTAGGSECSGTGQVCDTTLTSPVCACDNGYTATAGACVANVVGGTCAASGYECSALSGGYCKTGTGCACSAIYDLSGTSCTAKSCSAAADCTGIDPNSDCSGGSCDCAATYAIFNTGTSDMCQPGVGVTCTSSGGECQYILAGYCDTTTNANAPVCACAAIADIASQTCNFKACTADAFCTAIDPNSECIKGNCLCKSGYDINGSGTSNKCEQQSGSEAITASFVMVMACLVISFLQN